LRDILVRNKCGIYIHLFEEFYLNAEEYFCAPPGQDDAPLTGLPLLGYSVQLPGPADNIAEELVFKLQFKNHVYFFRAESSYTFERY